MMAKRSPTHRRWSSSSSSSSRILLIQALALAITTCSLSTVSAIYCDKDNCYDLLGVEQDAKLRDIKKAYFNLSLTYHPDKNPGDEKAKDMFQKIANAYEIVSDKESRKRYDYALKHPEEFMWNSMQYYRFRYSPKTDFRLVLLFTVAVLSALQFYGSKARYERAMTQAKRTTIFKQRLSNLEHEWLANREAEARAKALATKYGKVAKRTGKPTKDIPQDVRRQLMESIKLDVGCEPPDWWKTLGGYIIMLPVILYRFASFHASWTYKYRILGKSYESGPYADRALLTRKALKFPEHIWKDELSETQQASLVQRELWKPENLVEFNKERKKVGFLKACGGIPKPARVRTSRWDEDRFESDE